MAKESFTPDGVENKIDEVYAMTTINRMAEASAIESGFKTWISDNFNLDTPQTSFLTGLDSTVASNYGAACALAFRHMLGIALIVPTPRTPPIKWVHLNNNIVVSGDGLGGTEVTGSLTFEIEYR